MVALAAVASKFSFITNIAAAVCPPTDEADGSRRADISVRLSIDEALARWKDSLTGDGASASTIRTYHRLVEQVVEAQGWKAVDDVKHTDALAFIAARKRNDHGGIAWEVATCAVCITALRSFGEFLETDDLRDKSPFAKLKVPKRPEATHKHPYSEDEACRQLRAAWERESTDGRAKGQPTLFEATLFWTGLRHSELQAPCEENPYGGLKWRDVLLDGDFPGIWTDKKWVGNKNKQRQWLPLFPRLHALLKEQRWAVPSGPDDPVFPCWLIRRTWGLHRKAAGLPHADEDGRKYTVHAARASYCTWLGRLNIPEGLRKRLTRHDPDITERDYTVRSKQEMADAIAQLPDIWPERGGSEENNLEVNPVSPKDPCQRGPILYADRVSGAPGNEHSTNHNPSDRPERPVRHTKARPSAVVQSVGAGLPASDGVAGTDTEDRSGIPNSRIESLDRQTLIQTIRSLNTLVQMLAARVPDMGDADGNASAAGTDRRAG